MEYEDFTKENLAQKSNFNPPPPHEGGEWEVNGYENIFKMSLMGKYNKVLKSSDLTVGQCQDKTGQTIVEIQVGNTVYHTKVSYIITQSITE